MTTAAIGAVLPLISGSPDGVVCGCGCITGFTACTGVASLGTSVGVGVPVVEIAGG